MAQIIAQNSVLSAVGTIYEAKVQHLQALQLHVIDSGNGSSITVESSTDGVTYTAWGDIFTVSGGVLGSLGNNVFTTKGRFLIDLRGVNYIRVRVSTYVSGRVITEVQEAASAGFNSQLTAVAVGLTACGATQGTAFPISAMFNQFATVAVTTGAQLPVGIPAGNEVSIRNNGASALNLYPPTGGRINGGTVNTAVAISAGAFARFVSDGAGGFWQF